MADNRFKNFPTDNRFPTVGRDVRFEDFPIDKRFLDGADTRFQGDEYGGEAGPPAVAPSISGLPTISGTAGAGNTLTITRAPVTGTPTPTPTGQMFRDGAPIPGATGGTYLQTVADEGANLTFTQTETNTAGVATATSLPFAVPDPSVQRAAVVVLLGQSNNAPRGTSISGAVSPDVLMPVGGNSITYWPYNAGNALWTADWTPVASAVTHTEGALESPTSGVAIKVLGSPYAKVYAASCAIGARTLDVLRGAGTDVGPVANLYATIHRLCDFARAAGYQPEVMFSVHHGESDAFSSTGEQGYYDRGIAYYGVARGFAADAMGDPDYDAPIVFHMPTAYGSFGSAVNMRLVAEAIRRLAADIPNAILAGGSYQFPTEADRVHQTPVGMRLRGEHAGALLRLFADTGTRWQALQMVSASRVGTTVTVTFNRNIQRDTGVNYGTNLNTGTALAGMEFDDGGTLRQITNISISGNVATLTLATTPVSGTQHVMIASQAITGTLTAGSQNLPGSQIRSTAPGYVSTYDPGVTLQDFAIPQRIACTF